MSNFLDTILLRFDRLEFTVAQLATAAMVVLFASIIYYLLTRRLLSGYNKQGGGKKIRINQLRKTLKWIFCLIVLIGILESLDLNFSIGSYNETAFKINNIFAAILILFMANLLTWVLLEIVLSTYYKKNHVNLGSQYAINQLLKYVIYVMAAIIALDNVGIQTTVVWGGAAALLVGLGLGLQQTFNDLISGLILLFERTVEVGDVVEIENLVGTVKKIGLRTSLVETRDNITVIVPNSKLVIDNVINWSHYDNKARFKVMIGVAYGSDTDVVKQILLQVARKNIYVLKHPAPRIRFVNFGESSLDFELLFWASNFVVIEDIKSDLRFSINKAFRNHSIEIPFPQRDLWVRTNNVSSVPKELIEKGEETGPPPS